MSKFKEGDRVMVKNKIHCLRIEKGTVGVITKVGVWAYTMQYDSPTMAGMKAQVYGKDLELIK